MGRGDSSCRLRCAAVGTWMIKGRLRKHGPSEREWNTWDVEDAEVCNDFFASVFTGKCSKHPGKIAEGKLRMRRMDHLL